MNNGTLTKLSDIAEVTVGFVGSMTNEYVEDGIPFLRSKNVNPFKLNFDDLKFINEKFHKKINKSSLSPGDVVIVRTGKPGTCCVIPQNLKTANCSDLVIVKPGPKLDPYYFSYFMNSMGGNHVSAHLVGAVQQHFNVKSAKDMVFNLPPLPEQKAIAHILGTLDEKIELNRKMNQTLEAMAQALFKSWFVDFDPVIDNALAQGNDIPEELQTRAEKRKGLSDSKKLLSTNPSLAAQFPASFVFNETLGKWIPEGWEMDSLGSVCSLQNGFAFKSKDWQNDGTPVVKIGSVKPMIVDTSQCSYVSHLVAIQNKSFELKRGDILVGLTGYVGETGRILKEEKMPLLNQRVARFIYDKQFESFVYCLVRDSKFKDFAISMAHGSAQANISTKVLLNYEIMNPGMILISRFHSHIENWLEKILSAEEEIKTLTNLRDRLLPELISGRVRVEENKN